MVWLLLLLLLSVLQVLIIGRVVLLKNSTPEKTIVWLFILALFPIFGFIAYVVFGRRTRGNLFRDKPLAQLPYQQQRELDQNAMLSLLCSDSETKLARLLINSGSAFLSVNSQLEILLNGREKFTELFNALEGAAHHIHLSYYIFKNDEIGEDVAKILSRKVAEGVEVRVILDGMGSHAVSGNFIRTMQQSGIQTEWFFPIRFPYITSKLNLRYHRKVVIIDGCTGFMGGLNIGDEYLSRDVKLGFWRDTHLKLEGEAVHCLQSIFLNDWFTVTGQEIRGTSYFPRTKVSQSLPLQIVASGPNSDWTSILHGVFTAITLAKQMVYLETPYLIPNDSLMMALKTSALSGIDVRLIVQGIPEHKLIYWAAHSYYEELLRSGVRIFEYMKGTLHAKVLLIDERLASVGSTNIDIRSFNLDFEINAFVYDQSVAECLKLHFQQDLNESNEIIYRNFQTRQVFERFKESIARLVSSLL